MVSNSGRPARPIRIVRLVSTLVFGALVVAGCGSGTTHGSWDLLPPTTTTATPTAADALSLSDRARLAGAVHDDAGAGGPASACMTAGGGLDDPGCRTSVDSFVDALRVDQTKDDDPLKAALVEVSVAQIHAQLKLEALDSCRAAPDAAGCADALDAARAAFLNLYDLFAQDGSFAHSPAP